jgi:hydrogenase maturation protease
VKVLVIGYGNAGRADDGIGCAVAEAVDAWALPEVSVQVDWQLNIEHAVDLADCDIVVFADAAVAGAEPYEFSEITPSKEIAFTTHSVGPRSVLALCQDLYGRAPRGFLLSVRGHDFAFGAPLTNKAHHNVREALAFLKNWLKQQDLSADRNPVNRTQVHSCSGEDR